MHTTTVYILYVLQVIPYILTTIYSYYTGIYNTQENPPYCTYYNATTTSPPAVSLSTTSTYSAWIPAGCTAMWLSCRRSPSSSQGLFSPTSRKGFIHYFLGLSVILGFINYIYNNNNNNNNSIL